MRRALFVGMILALVGAGVPVAQAAGPPQTYIVVLNASAGDPADVAREHAGANGARVDHVYRHALRGYAARMSDVAAARIANDARVAYVEPDGEVQAWTTQTGATWGLDRIDQRDLPLSLTYSYDATGAGVTAYIIDTGITAHPDFGGRVVSGIDYVNDDADSTDCDGHGTHVAGTVGSATYGVAKGVTLVGVRVLDCNGSGSWSDVIAGINWVTGQHAAGTPAVANMSLGGGFSSSVNQAVANSIADGVTYAVAAGNGNQAGQGQDACNYSPASAPAALTTGATSSSDAKPTWSNYGTCLDLFAPGVSITSTTMDGGTGTWSGTSMATPHVAGVAALYLQNQPTASPAQVASAITSSATTGKVTGAGSGSPNRLLYSLLTASPPSDPPPTTTVSAAPTQRLSGGKGNKKDLFATATVTAGTSAVAGAGVSAVITNATSGQTWSVSGTTASDGTVTWKLANAPNGCYTTKITSVTPPRGYTWDGAQNQSASLCKT